MQLTPPEMGHGPKHELYVYYRAPEHHADALMQAVHQMQMALRAAHPGLQARLLRRPEPEDGQHTWMEAYGLPDSIGEAAADAADHAAVEGFAAAIAEAAQSLRPWIAGARHVEHFRACAW